MSMRKVVLAAALGATALAEVASYEGNPFDGVSQSVNPYYRDEIYNLAIPQMSKSMAKKAKLVAEVPSFQWLDKIEKLELFSTTLASLRERNQAGANPHEAGQFVIYNFPDRDCSAKSSDGELHLDENGLERYKTDYIDPIVELIKEYSDVRIIIIYEPDGLANLITNMEVEKCAGAADAYAESTVYALAQLDLPNVALYLDASHSGWTGWPGNLNATATIYGDLYKKAGSPKAVRGLATNVSNYNPYNTTEPLAYTDPNPNWDESKYHAAIAPYLEDVGFPAHFIVDQGRSGAQPAGRLEWGHWCNIKDTGFGIRPTSDTPTELLDAFVWVKPGGEGDGTSDETATRYDEMCRSDSSLVPAPEAGSWFQEYFEMLIENANPPFGKNHCKGTGKGKGKGKGKRAANA
ncbi:related to exoglucanase 2 precursor [Cephalotrichum gorgonifer]|uniref:Glucanase n=1 Tax=Cephalotrichum gorgonifer TaxID=2041049 RepID=A0AAE8MTF5_9PEZI|nr:related to exoglucanase 2 precursor [Cephalotrichum gorgonifer]